MTPSPQPPRPSASQQPLFDLIFGNDCPEDWVQDVWDMSPTLGETAARLVEALWDLGDRLHLVINTVGVLHGPYPGGAEYVDMLLRTASLQTVGGLG